MQGKPLKKSFVLLTTSIAAFITPFLSSAIAFAVPRIGIAFHLNFYEAAILPMIFLIPLSSFMIFFGRLSDDVGRVTIFRMGLIIFSAATFAAAFSRNYDSLVISIFFAGLGTAVLSTNSTAIVSFVYSSGRRGFALGINAMSVYLGLTFAPFLGGFLIEFFGWASIFLLSAPLAVIGLAISMISMRNLETEMKMNKASIRDPAVFAAFILTLTSYAAFGNIFGYVKILFLAVISVFIFILFIILERRPGNPTIPPSMIRGNRTFVASNITAFLNYLGTFSIVFVFSIYLQVILHISPFLSGLTILPEPIIMVLLSPVAGRLADKVGSRFIASAGMFIIGFSFFSLFLNPSAGKIFIMVVLGFIGLGFGLFSAPNTNSVMSSTKREYSGIASGFLGTMRFTGQLISIVMATFVLSIYIPKPLIVGMFSGTVVAITPYYYHGFIEGFKVVMILSALLSVAGAFTSLMKNRGK
ncbi:MAG: MFS transporter [Thermoplasmata archaeon]